MDVQQEVLRVLDETLSLGGRALRYSRDTHLMGSVPELDSMAVVNVITSLEDQFGIAAVAQRAAERNDRHDDQDAEQRDEQQADLLRDGEVAECAHQCRRAAPKRHSPLGG